MVDEVDGLLAETSFSENPQSKNVVYKIFMVRKLPAAITSEHPSPRHSPAGVCLYRAHVGMALLIWRGTPPLEQSCAEVLRS